MRRSLGSFHPTLSLGFGCMDCGCDTRDNEHYYMVADGLWRSVNPKMDGMLCLPCLENRLGRSLYARDFQDSRINIEQALVCPELAARLARRAPKEGKSPVSKRGRKPRGARS
jgi:hypothetical protein